jgi:S-(hydroxymethyl)glutathione dehydrogenase/alcohol dehydrogenase
MKTKAAIIWAPTQGFEVAEIDLDPPKAGEALVRWMASGICHSDYHAVEGTDATVQLPVVAGHEGAGIVEAVGPGVTRVKPGDHFVATTIPSCGHCRWCATGRQYLCDVDATVAPGALLDGTYRFHANGRDLGGFSRLGTFSQRSVVSEYSLIKIDNDIPFEVACLFGCSVPTGWGSAVVAADVEPGETVVIYGAGGVGMSAVQGARYAGARDVVVVDPQPFKLEKAREFGATHVVATAQEAKDIVFGLTDGVWADRAIVTVANVTEQVVSDAFDVIRKAGTLALASTGAPLTERTLHVSNAHLTMWKKRVQGVVVGNMNLQYDVSKLLGLYKAGRLKVNELITRKYRLEEINQGFQDMLDGKNIRGIVVHEH